MGVYFRIAAFLFPHFFCVSFRGAVVVLSFRFAVVFLYFRIAVVLVVASLCCGDVVVSLCCGAFCRFAVLRCFCLCDLLW